MLYGLIFFPMAAGLLLPLIGSRSLRARNAAMAAACLINLAFSGIVKINLYPFNLHAQANAMPVFPLVGSTITLSFVKFPFFFRIFNHIRCNPVFQRMRWVEILQFC